MSEVSENYVNYVFEKKEKDKAFRAAMRNATRENFEWKAWPYIATFTGKNMRIKDIRHIYAIIGKAIAKSHKSKNGDVSFGRAMQLVEKDGKDFSKVSARMARILSFDEFDDLIDVLEPVLTLIEARNINLNYAELLDDLFQGRFEDRREQLKARWASDYFGKESE